jgi:hypothetical protein
MGVVQRAGSDHHASVCVIAGLSTGSPRIVSHWRIDQGLERKPVYLHYRRMPNEDTVVVTHNNRVRVFDTATGRERRWCQVPPFSEPAVSPRGRLIALRRNDQYVIVETETGRAIGAIPANGILQGSVGFSPSGQMLAITSEDRLWVYSLSDGRLLREHNATVGLGAVGAPTIWPHQRFLITPTGMLVDLSKNVLSWQYKFHGNAKELIDRPHAGLFAFAGGESIRFVRLPHVEAGRASNREIADLAAIKKGDAVQILVEVLDGLKVDQGKVRSDLENAVTTAGYRVAASSDVELIARFRRGKEREETYFKFGEGGKVTVRFRPYFVRRLVSSRPIVQARASL